MERCHRPAQEESQVRILTESGEVLDQRIRTTRDRLTALFWGHPRAKDFDRRLVVVVDPNYSLTYGHRSRRVKPIVAMSRPAPKRVAMGFIDARIVGRRASGWCSGT